jgi:hypothetical protein
MTVESNKHFEFIKSNLTQFHPERDASESSNKSKHEYPQKRFKNRVTKPCFE